MRQLIADDSHAQAWDAYWSEPESIEARMYQRIAAFYRRYIFKPALTRRVRNLFSAGDTLLHAGCGTGQVDAHIAREMKLTALDISAVALNQYHLCNPAAYKILQGTILNLPFNSGEFDGIYNLGVMEHFSESDIDRILGEFYRVLKPEGRVLLFWPPQYGFSVGVLKTVHLLLRKLAGSRTIFHPDEPTLIRSKEHAVVMLNRAGFSMESFSFGAEDAFTHAVIVCKKNPPGPRKSGATIVKCDALPYAH